MRLQSNDYGFDSQLPTDEFESTIENSEKMFAILSDHIYKDKILAVIRELSCNAYDAMVDAGKKDVPFKLHLPTRLDPTFYVEDDGVGIDPQILPKIYLTYGKSTKTESDETIGALGLGSKSPFAYTKSSFIVRNRWNGIEYSYFVFINKSGKPAMSAVGQEPTDRGNGMRAEFAVKPQDISAFFDRTDRFFKYWKNVLPIFVDQDPKRVLVSKIDKVIDNGDWYLENRDDNADFKGALAVMGNIPYPIEVDSIPNLPPELKVIAQNSFVIEFPLGSLAFQPSREALSFDEFTNKNLIERLEEVRAALAKTFQNQVFAKGKTQLEFRNNFYKKLIDFSNVIRVETINTVSYSGDRRLSWAVQVLLGKSEKDTVQYDGFNYSINDLMNRRSTITVNDHQPFAVISESTRGKNARLYMQPSTTLKFVSNKVFSSEEIFNDRGRYDVKVGHKFEFDWASSVFPTRKELKEYSLIQRVMMLDDKVDVTTINTFQVESPTATFVINDEGGAGEQKYKSYLVNKKNRVGDYFFIKHNNKEINIVDLTAKVAEFIDKNGLRGAKIEFTSDLEDLRPAIAKVKKERGVKKLSHYTFTFLKRLTTETVVGTGRKYKCHPYDVDGSKHTHKLFSIEELKNSTVPFLYVKKNRFRNDTFEPGSNKRAYITNEKTAVMLALNLGMLDDIAHESIDGKQDLKYTVLALNDSDFEELKKKGVKLVGLQEHVKAKVEEMFKTHDYFKDVEDDIAINGVESIRQLYAKMTPLDKKAILTSVGVIKGSDSLFVSLLKKYDAYMTNKDLHLMSYVMMTMYQYFINFHTEPNRDKVKKFEKEIKKTYPILPMVSFMSVDKDGLHAILEYIADIDSKHVNVVNAVNAIAA